MLGDSFGPSELSIIEQCSYQRGSRDCLRTPPAGGQKCRFSVEKLSRLQIGVRLWEVSAYGRCPLMGRVHLQCSRLSVIDIIERCLC